MLWACHLQGSLFRLQEIRVLGRPGANCLLELAGQATICYVVQDEAVNSAGSMSEAPVLYLDDCGAAYGDAGLPVAPVHALRNFQDAREVSVSKAAWTSITLVMLYLRISRMASRCAQGWKQPEFG